MHKAQQRAHELRDVVGKLLRATVEFPPDTVVTVTKAAVSADGLVGTVFLSVFPEGQSAEVLALVERRHGDLQRGIAARFSRHPSPRVRYVLDAGPAALDRLDRLSRSARNNA